MPGTLPARIGKSGSHYHDGPELFIAASEARELGDRRLAVIVPGTRLRELGEAVAGEVPTAGMGPGSQQDSQVVVIDTRQAKGLEFDVVLVAEPGQIVADSPRGLNDLYVALTRATQRHGVIHAGELPAALKELRPAGAHRRKAEGRA